MRSGPLSAAAMHWQVERQTLRAVGSMRGRHTSSEVARRSIRIEQRPGPAAASGERDDAEEADGHVEDEFLDEGDEQPTVRRSEREGAEWVASTRAQDGGSIGERQRERSRTRVAQPIVVCLRAH